MLDAAKEKNVWAVGVDADQSYIHPKHILTSATKHVDVGLQGDPVRRERDVQGRQRRLRAEDKWCRPRQDQPARPAQSEVAAVEKIRAEIVSGKITNIPTTVK